MSARNRISEVNYPSGVLMSQWFSHRRKSSSSPKKLDRRTRPAFDTLERRDVPSASIESIDGTGNNVQNPMWGSDNIDLLRTAPAAYADGVSSPGGANRPSARQISNTLDAQGDVDINSTTFLSAMAYEWGQFIDHDIDLTNDASPAQPFNIAVPTGDPSFDPGNSGNQVIPLNRSQSDPNTGLVTANGKKVPLQQVNSITAWIDGSMIYGSDTSTALKLRTLMGGELKTSAGDLLPVDNAATFPTGTVTMANAGPVPSDQMFAAGDVRANENVELTAMQTLFVREHNRLAEQIATANPGLNDEQIYQQARALVIGEIQAITYNEWLPSLLGHPLAPYFGYNPKVNPGIANEFSTAIFRFGHSMVGNDVEFLDNNGNAVTPSIPFSGAFFNPAVVQATGIDPLLKYLSSDPSQNIDLKVVDSLRNFLFGPPGSGGLDLASLNIQRGRDHGLADYNSTRAAYGLPKVTSFAQITSNVDVQNKLKQLYGNVNNIDLWVGALAEDHLPGSSVGPLINRVLSDQFLRLRDGDRFFYKNQFSGATLNWLDSTTLADVIKRNTTITNLQGNVFVFRVAITGQVFNDVNGNGKQNLGDFGIAGRTVQLIDPSDNSVIATTTTDRFGFYHFDTLNGLGVGQYLVREVLPNGAMQTTALPGVMDLTKGDSFVTNVNFGETGGPAPTPCLPGQQSSTGGTTTGTTPSATDMATPTQSGTTSSSGSTTKNTPPPAALPPPPPDNTLPPPLPGGF
jgi:hypothetical protein